MPQALILLDLKNFLTVKIASVQASHLTLQSLTPQQTKSVDFIGKISFAMTGKEIVTSVHREKS